ncbi:MAG: hypothetical protein CMJ67_09235 [Planctomycetaceae bacterium]|nr:hypothetical protein [Planctomycetaceae bacterium]
MVGVKRRAEWDRPSRELVNGSRLPEIFLCSGAGRCACHGNGPCHQVVIRGSGGDSIITRGD